MPFFAGEKSMNRTLNITVFSLSAPRRWMLILALLALLPVAEARAQSSGSSVTDGTTPLGLTPGAPAGSYALSGFENVNPYNGNLNFVLPLLSVGARGGVQHTLPLKIEQHWRTIKTQQTQYQQPYFYPTPNSWEGLVPGYGPGIMTGRVTGVADMFSCPESMQAVTRMTFTAGDGTEYEFRDALNDGQIKENTYSGDVNFCDIFLTNARGRVFSTFDGSAITFISDAVINDFYGRDQKHVPNPTGYMLMRDGTRYRLESGLVQWLQDRNGNRLTFHYNSYNDVDLITDSLNRTVTIDYSYQYTGTSDPHALYDEIHYKGFGGASRSVKIYFKKLKDCLRTTQSYDSTTTKWYTDLFPEIQWVDGDNRYNPWKFSAVELPDGRQYQFYYNVYGELARVVLPTGGAFEYDYLGAQPGGPDSGAFSGNYICRRVTERRVYSDGVTLENRTTFERPADNGAADITVEVAQYDNASGLLARSKHYYHGSPRESFLWSLTAETNYSKWQDGKEWKTETYDTDGSLKQQVTNTWEQSGTVSWWTGSANLSPANNPHLASTTTKLMDTGQVTQQVYRYDQYNNKTEVDEYDFGANGPGVLKRRTHTDYLATNLGVNYITVNPNTSNPDINQTIHLRSLPVEQLVYDGADLMNPKARTTYEYDNYTSGLTDRANITGHARVLTPATYTTSYVTRGNVTQVTKWVLPSTQISMRTQYDIAGNVVGTTDALGRTSLIDYTDRFGTPDGEARNNVQAPSELSGGVMTYGFATKVTNPAPFNHTAYTQFDYYLGKPVNSEDPNGVVNSGRYSGYADGSYSDALDRATELVVAVGTGVQRRTRFLYNDGARQITTTSDQANFTDGGLRGDSFYDGLGQTVKTQQTVPDTGGVIISEQKYDALGRKSQASNPYRVGEAVVWTTTFYDGLSRVKQVTTPDNAVVTTAYVGNQVTVTDQASKKRRSFSDALGRLTQIDELQESGVLYASTFYSYDVLDDLVRVQQGGQNRYFMYDALKRLVRARNPEQDANAAIALVDTVTTNSQWSMAYSYDNNGNLTQKIDARNLTTSYSYDELNRLKTRIYTNDPQNTPTVTYTYEGAGVPYSKGHLTQVSSAVSAYDYLQFDALGRVKQSQQTTAGQSYMMNYQYNLAGVMIQETYPSGRVVNTTYDAAGRLSGVNGANASLGETTRQYVSQVGYTPHGVMKSIAMGNGLVESTTFNTRLQLTQIKLGTTGNPASVVQMDYSYGVRTGGVLDATRNNGNVEGQTISLPGLSVVQSYTYDAVNRLSLAIEKLNSVMQWQQGFSYDAYGNRSFDVANTTSNVMGPNPLISTASNRVSTSGYGYDAAGNMTGEPSTPTNKSYGYDGENRQVSYTDNGQTTVYSYDGDGRRVKKQNPDGSVVVFVYDTSGHLTAEYNSSTASTSQPYQTSYLTVDHLGSTRVMTDGNGTVKSRRDYMPFGEELQVGLSGRTTVMKYGATDGLRQQFTSQERDTESGLDYFGARYHSSGLGRFASADPLLASGKPSQPQSWNRYSYCINNPLVLVDPSGLMWYVKKGDNQPVWFENNKNPGDGYDIASSVYWGGTGNGYIALDTREDRWKVGFTTEAEAQAASNAMTTETLNLTDGGADYGIINSALSITPNGFFGHGGFVNDAISDVDAKTSFPYVNYMPVGAGMPFAPVGSGGGLMAGESGAFGSLARRGTVGDGLTPHHMPQAALNFTSRAEGGALVLPHAEHILTRTYGARGAVTAQAERGLSFRDVFARDIRDIRSIAGSKYNSGLLNLTNYYRINFPPLIQKK
jgi:RHS repeat-associated protein